MAVTKIPGGKTLEEIISEELYSQEQMKITISGQKIPSLNLQY